MTISFWCVFVALMLPYIFAVLSRWGNARQDYVSDPRGFNERLSGWRRRAHFAQLNAFETFPAFAVAVIIAHIASVPSAQADAASVVFIASRLCHGAFYLGDRPLLRSASWQVGMLAIVALFVLSALAGEPA